MMFEHIMMSLHFIGLDILDFNERYDIDFVSYYQDAIISIQVNQL